MSEKTPPTSSEGLIEHSLKLPFKLAGWILKGLTSIVKY